jgi:sugar O-acyltransferase (sialic acid O-acetyltransferase NeuD family)
MRVLILGAGGHGQVVADALICAHQRGDPSRPIGYLDDDMHLCNQSRLGLPVLGSLDQIGYISHDAIIVAVGDNRTRYRICERMQEKGEHFAIVIHPRSVVASDVQIGHGSVVCPGAIVNTGSVIGANVIVNTGCTIDHHNQIDDYAHVAPGAHLGGDVVIGTGTLIGIGTVVIPQRRVQEWSVVGAGAVVTEDIRPYTTAVGVPAREIGNESCERSTH